MLKLQVILAATVSVAGAATLAIGVAMTNSDLRVDHSRIGGNATILDGSTLETGAGPARLDISGARLKLGRESKSTVYRNRLMLEKGDSEFTGRPYSVEALAVRVSAAERGSIGRVSLRSPKVVEVAALTGDVQVTSLTGMVLAKVLAGSTLAFSMPAAEDPASSTVTGIVVKKNGQYLLTDEVSQVTFEVQGPDVASKAGKRVEVTGVSDSSESKVLRVTAIKDMPRKAAVSPSKAGKVARAGLSKAKIWGFGVAIAGATVATTALVKSGDEPATMSPTR
jgi:hypothetical protein